jgi:MinD-like ATPase involved in chromosome partitioning or flagellar assembly
MTAPVLTAVGDPRWEAHVTAGLNGAQHGVRVVRRCVDLADLLAAAAAGLGVAAIVSADLRRLDREAVGRLALAGVAVVGLVAPDDEAAEQRLRQLGVDHVRAHDVSATDLSMTVLVAIAALAPPPDGALQWSDPSAALHDADPAAADLMATIDEPPAGTGRVVAVWGPAGAPGRTTLAVNLAAELAALGHPALLVDADTYGGVVAQLLGLLDEAPGLAAACRHANHGALEANRLAELAVEVKPGLRVLTGITRSERWLELRPGALEVVLSLARALARYVVVDCGFCLEQDEELAFDTISPRRNGATLAAIDAADLVVGVAAADPVGLARYVRALPDCTALASEPVLTVVNRLRRSVTGRGDPRREVTAALGRYAGLQGLHLVPDDRASLDAALAGGRTLSEVAAKSGARLAIRDLANRVATHFTP